MIIFFIFSSFHSRCEKLTVQLTQQDKQRQEDVYQMTTSLREKEALGKADVRRVEEKMKNLFDEFIKSARTSEGKLRQEFESKVLDMERVRMNQIPSRRNFKEYMQIV